MRLYERVDGTILLATSIVLAMLAAAFPWILWRSLPCNKVIDEGVVADVQAADDYALLKLESGKVYRIPPHEADGLTIGHRVVIKENAFGNRKVEKVQFLNSQL